MIAASCGGGDDPAPSNPVTRQDQIYFIGNMHGELGDDIETLLGGRLVPYDGQSIDKPILVSIPEGETLDESLKASLKAAFENGVVVAIEHATEDEVNAFLEILGLEPTFHIDASLPIDGRYVEIFAIHQKDGDIFSWVSYPDDLDTVKLLNPLEDTPNDLDYIGTDGGPWLSETDDEAHQTRRANNFIDWIDDREDQENELARNKLSVKASGIATANSSNALTELARAHVQTVDVSIYGMTFQMTYTVYAFHSFTDPSSTDYDWFYIEQRAMLNPSVMYARDPGHGLTVTQVRGYAVNYEFDNAWSSPTPSFADAALIQSSPTSANNVATLTSGFEWNLGGSIGFDGKSPTGSVSGGISVSSSESVQVSDCEAINQSAANVSNAKWSYQFRRPTDGSTYFSWRDLNDATWLSRNNFQPVNKWIWKLSPSFRNDSNRTRFQSTLKTTIGYSNGAVGSWWIMGSTTHKNWFSHEQTVYIPLNYPPLITVESGNVSFSRSAGYKPVALNVSRQWTGETDQPWCTISPTSGVGNDGEVYISAAENTTGADRNATVTLKTRDGKGKTQVKVFQSQY